MLARQVMTMPVVAVAADASVYEAAEILLNSGISAAPVVDADGRMIGIVSEADLMYRPEIATVPGKSWLERLLTDDKKLVKDFVHSHSHRVADVMTRNVVSARDDATLKDVAELMQHHRVKRIPIVRDKKVVGVVSRANLLQGLLAHEPAAVDGSVDDEQIRAAAMAELAKHRWSTRWPINVFVQGGVVHLWGNVDNAATNKACQVCVEGVPGVRRVKNHMALMSS